MTARNHYTCASCGSSDVQVTAWIDANTSRIIDGDAPLEVAWCSKCEANVDLEADPIEDVDPAWWVANGFRCNGPLCVKFHGCESCALYVCTSCFQIRPWSDGGDPDPRCESCFGHDQRLHVGVALELGDARELSALLSHESYAAKRRAVAMQEAARVRYEKTLAVMDDPPLMTARQWESDSAAGRARAATDHYLRIARMHQRIKDAIRIAGEE